MYLDGRGVAQDYFAAHIWLNLAGSRDLLSDAARRLNRDQITEAQARAWALWESFEARRDWRQVKTLEEAAEAVGQHRIEARYDSLLEDPVLQVLEQSAKAGDPEAQAELALHFRSGRDMPKSYEQAVHWYRLAAAQDYAPAMLGLSGLYYAGEGVEKNERIAARWRLRAAQRGVKGAFYWTAVGYHQGDTLPQNYILAYVWYSLTINEGEGSAENLPHLLLQDMTTTEIAEAEEHAEAWRKKFANDLDAAD